MNFNPKQIDLFHANANGHVAAQIKFTYLVFLMVTATAGRGKWQN